MSLVKLGSSFQPLKVHWLRYQFRFFQTEEDAAEHLDNGWKNWKYGELPFHKIKDFSHFSSFANMHFNNADFVLDGNLPPNLRHFESGTVDKCITVLSKHLSEKRKKKLNEVLQNRTRSVRFVFEQPHNPNNVWAALRTLDSFGIQFADIICANNSPRGADMKGAALGSQKWMTVHQHESLDFMYGLKKRGYLVVATDLHSSSIPFQTLKSAVISSASSENIPCQILVVMGNEINGISSEMRTLADHLIYLPMKGFAESFNLSVATAVLCANLQQQNFLDPNFSITQKNRLLFCWYLKNIGRSNGILKEHGINEFQFNQE